MKNVENDAARAALHGIVAAALTQLAGGNGADGLKAGAAGAVTASLLSERLVSALYGKDVSQLTADEKRLVSNLVSIDRAWYLGPAATAGKVIGGGILGLTANGGYQYYDLSKPGNESKSWDYLGSATSFTMGTLAPGRGIWVNTGIAMGGAVFTDGPNGAAIAGAGLGAWSGGTFGKFGPFSSEVNYIFGAFGGEFISNKVKDAGKKE
ncbi:adhesin [Leclercia pneumoniae]|uniref:adhesin n=1 Tax=Leclercia pneumoniae TaxID=2815358 RepID=UPI002B286AEF|nr:adhesin [Leclercia pneumoniae]